MNWDTVVTSVTASVTATMAWEYLAKPRLEARKERILDAWRSRGELSAALIPITQATEMLLLDPLKNPSSELRENLQAERQRQYERLQEQTQRLYDDIGRYAGTYVNPYRDLVMRFVMSAYGVMLSARPQHEKARIIKAMAVPMATALNPSWWHPLVAAQARKDVEQAITAIELPDESIPAPAVP